jgi:hypothetical protein
MDYRYLGSIFRGPLTGVTIGYYPMPGPRAPHVRRQACHAATRHRPEGARTTTAVLTAA